MELEQAPVLANWSVCIITSVEHSLVFQRGEKKPSWIHLHV